MSFILKGSSEEEHVWGQTKGVQKVDSVWTCLEISEGCCISGSGAEGESWLGDIGAGQKVPLGFSHIQYRKTRMNFGQPNTTVGGVKRYS